MNETGTPPKWVVIPRTLGKILRWLLVAAVLAFLGNAWHNHFYQPGKRQRDRAHSVRDLKQIAIAVSLFASDNGGTPPASLSALTKAYLPPTSSFSKNKVAAAGGWRDYLYFPPPPLKRIGKPRQHLLACDQPRNYPDGGHVLFADGDVQWFEADAFRDMLDAARRSGSDTAPPFRTKNTPGGARGGRSASGAAP